MYPILETKRLLLEPLKESDYDDIIKMFSNPIVTKTMEHDWKTEEAFRKEFIELIKSGIDDFAIRLKKTNKFIGYFQLHNYIGTKKGTVKYSQLNTALLPEYWGKRYCTEATKKILHFAFLGIKTPWLCANHLCINPAAGKVLQKCGLTFWRTLKAAKGQYDQYRYNREDYLKNNAINIDDKENIYNYSFEADVINLMPPVSPYSYKNPVRKINNIKYIKEPTGYLCGQSVIAMLANVSVDEVIDIMKNDKGTSTPEIGRALKWYGIKHAKSRIRFTADTTLPELCILSLRLPGYGHWSLYYKGTYYDPEFGVSKNIPPNAELHYYWEING